MTNTIPSISAYSIDTTLPLAQVQEPQSNDIQDRISVSNTITAITRGRPLIKGETSKDRSTHSDVPQHRYMLYRHNSDAP